MDETGPYLPCSPDSKRNMWESDGEELKRSRVLLGPEKPYSLESRDDETRKDKKRKVKVGHSRKHKSKEKSIDKKKKKKRKEKRAKYHK